MHVIGCHQTFALARNLHQSCGPSLFRKADQDEKDFDCKEDIMYISKGSGGIAFTSSTSVQIIYASRMALV